MNFNCLKSGLAATAWAAGTLFTACTNDIEIGNTDKGNYDVIFENNGYLCDAMTKRASGVVELYEENYETGVKIGLTHSAATPVIGHVAYDATYLETYNAQHGTSFELYPEELVSIDDKGTFIVYADSFESTEVSVSIATDESLDEEKTYVIPLSVTDMTGSAITLKEQARHCVYLVKDRRLLSDCYKGESAPKGFLIFEVGDTNPLNALVWELENGKLLWDAVVLFSGNINYHQTDKRPYVSCNESVQFLLDNTEVYLQPLRKRGIKVLLGILGNGDEAGIAQLSATAAKDFAREMAAYCDTYKLDGIMFDEEYSRSPDLNNPAFVAKSAIAAGRLCYETKQAMPDKWVTVYALGAMPGKAPEGIDPDEYLDVIVADYGEQASPQGNMSLQKCSGVSIEFAQGSGSLWEGASSIKEKGYGWFMGFAMDPSHFGNDYGRLSLGCSYLYKSELKYPSVYYKKNDPTPYAL